MHKSTWKRHEREAAALFGSKRNRCSGSSGRADLSRSDSMHPRLYIEVKSRAKASMTSLFDATREEAKREGKLPLLLLSVLNRPGFVFVCEAKDLAAIAAELATNPEAFTPPTEAIEP